MLNPEEISRIAKKLSLNVKTAELLFARGLQTEEDIKRFLNPNKSDFFDPFLLKGMDKAVDRINLAINNKEKILVYGDYDADGVCATAILTKFFVSKGLEIYPYIPSRTSDGYGLNIETLERIIDDAAPDLIVTCDCGISAINEVEHCLDLGVDIIVTDHHEVSAAGVPSCVVINPKQNDCEYPIKYLCGAGVAFKLVAAVAGLDEALKYVDLAAVATIADLVPLLSENRLIVQLGLKRANIKNSGLAALLSDQNVHSGVMSSDIAFKIAPRINAAGRMGDAYRALELLTTEDAGKISEIIKEINIDNNRRKELSDEMFFEALGDIQEEDLSVNRAIVLSHPSWEKGITGILAARVTGEYRRPSFIVVLKGGEYKGTCRAFGDINVFDILSSVSDLLTEFGGHTSAAGFTLPKENMEEFKRRVNEYAAALPEEMFLPSVEYDADIKSGEITLDFAKELELFEPLGNSNPSPIFRCVESGSISVSPIKSNVKHSLIALSSSLSVTAFNFYNQNQFLLGDGIKELALEVSVNRFNSKETVRAVLRGVAPSKLYVNDEIAKANYIKNVQIKKKGEPINLFTYKKAELNSIIGKGIFGTLIVAGQQKSYEEFISLNNPCYFYREFMYSTINNNYNRATVSPVFDGSFDLSNYSKIIFLDYPIGDGLIPFLNRKTKAKIYVPEESNANDFLDGVDFSRAAFIKIYELIKSNQDLYARDIFLYFKALKKRTGGENLSAVGFISALSVFYDLGFIALEKEPFKISINKGVSTELNDSGIYNYFLTLSGGTARKNDV